jgi:hypothetical protein
MHDAVSPSAGSRKICKYKVGAGFLLTSHGFKSL